MKRLAGRSPLRFFLFPLALALLFTSCAHRQTVTLLHFSDYHSHARPFFAEESPDHGGISRAIAYLRSERKRGAIVLSGGDMINKGAPAWSDKYGCVEWPWLNGTVEAMAYGNHDSDYGPEAFARCRASIDYPILSANTVDANGAKIFDAAGKPYLILRRGRARIGIFAVAGSDYEKLVKPELRPAPDVRFTDPIEAARNVVAQLRAEKVDAVVMIGHEHREEDEVLARAVPGIDLIFGTHSHIKEALHQIEGTTTWSISPFQYLTYISRVELTLSRGRVASASGELVRVDAHLPEDEAINAKVAELQRGLESDPLYAPLFQTVGNIAHPLLLTDQLHRQTPLGVSLMSIVRDAAHADLAISTTSSFRQPLAAGALTMEELRATLPYPNKILVYELSGAQLRVLLEVVEGRAGSDSYAQMSPLPTIDDAKTYRVATTDYLAKVATAYRQIFAQLTPTDSGLEVREEVRKAIAAGFLHQRR